MRVDNIRLRRLLPAMALLLGIRGMALLLGIVVICGSQSAYGGEASSAVPVGAVLDGLPRLSVTQAYSRLMQLPPRIVNTKGVSGADELGQVVVVKAPRLRLESVPGAAKLQAELGVEAWSPMFEHADGNEFLGDFYLVFSSGSSSPEEIARRWSRVPGVEAVEPYYVSHLDRVPDDPDLTEQPYLDVIQAYQAWDVTTGQDRPVMVAVVDGGMDATHPDLRGNITESYNFATETSDPGALIQQLPTSVKHGTHVSGIISAVTNNARQISGVSWNAPLMLIAANDADDDNSIIFGYQGIVYAVDHGAKIINCSWGRPLVASRAERAVLEYAVSQGAIVIAAAGNQRNFFNHFPAAYPEAFAVANVTNTGERSNSSNFGLWVDVAAPGTDILSLFPEGETGTLSGTSMASPVVSAVVSLLWGLHPELDAQQVLHRIRVSSHDLDAVNPEYQGLLGHGLIQAFDALEYDGPGYRITSTDIHDGNENGEIEAGEQIEIIPTWKNILSSSAAEVVVSLRVDQENAMIGYI